MDSSDHSGENESEEGSTVEDHENKVYARASVAPKCGGCDVICLTLEKMRQNTGSSHNREGHH